jgi:hypothetical protein
MDKSDLSIAAPDLNPALQQLALAAAGKTGADIERLIREARQKARREKRQLTYTDIHEALTAGQTTMPPELVWRIAVHEAGHALAWTLFDIAIVQTCNGWKWLWRLCGKRNATGCSPDRNLAQSDDCLRARRTGQRKSSSLAKRVLAQAEMKGLTSRERRSLQLMLKLILGSGMPSHCSIDL